MAILNICLIPFAFQGGLLNYFQAKRFYGFFKMCFFCGAKFMEGVVLCQGENSEIKIANEWGWKRAYSLFSFKNQVPTVKAGGLDVSIINYK